MEKTLLIAALLAVALLLLLTRIAGGRYGTLQPSDEATAAYESYRVDEGRQYFSSGPEGRPNALLGLEADWTLENDLWKRREMTPGEMKATIQGMQAQAQERMTPLHGFEILDDRGFRIGNGFSVLGPEITVEVKDRRRVVITTPPQVSDPSA